MILFKNRLSRPQDLLLNQLTILTDKITDLSVKVDSLITLPSKVDSLIAEVDNIGKNLLTLEKRVSNNESRISDVEKSLLSTSSIGKPCNSGTIIAEMNGRASRSRNIIIFNLIDFTDKNVDLRKKHELNLIEKLVGNCLPDADCRMIKLLQVGKKHDNKIPLKIIFNNDSDA